MIDERQEELAALYALDMLEGEERMQFETALAREPTLRNLVQEMRESSAELARVSPVAPPPELRARVLGAIAAAGDARPRANSKLVLFRAFAPWAMAACFAVAGLWLAQRSATIRGELELARTEAEIARLGLRGARTLLEAERIVTQKQVSDLAARAGDSEQKLADSTRNLADVTQRLNETMETARRRDAELADAMRRLAAADTELATMARRMQAEGDLANLKIATLASLLNNSPQAVAVAVWNPERQEGVLQVQKLPALAADKDYQLWVVDPQYPAPVDGGVFTVDQEGGARLAFKSRQPVNVIDAFAVTLERKGGVPKAEGPFVLLGK